MQSVARALLNIKAVGFSPKSPITFKSGIVSPVYVDNRQLIFHPNEWHTVVEGFNTILQEQSLAYDVIAGVAVGGVPHSSALAYITDTPSVFIRKEAKGHGKGNRIEGGDVSNKTVLLVEDLVTTGGSSLSGVDALRDAGARVTDVLAIVSYGFTESRQAFADANLNLHTLTNFDTILEIALEQNLFTTDESDIIHDWFNDPHNWGAKYA